MGLPFIGADRQIGPITWGIALMASMGGFVFGFDTGLISDVLVMEDFIHRFGQQREDGTFGFSRVREGLIVAMLSVGTAIGALLGAGIADSLGRRKAMSVNSVIVCVGVVIQCTAMHAWYQVMIGRIVTGFGVGALSAAVPAYQSETAPKEIRGSLVATYQLFITLGILTAYAVCIGTRDIGGRGEVGSLQSAQWRLPIALTIVWAVILGVGILFMPESPRWLMMRGRYDEAANALARIRGVHGKYDHPLVARDYGEIEESLQQQRERDASGTKQGWLQPWLDCFKPERKVLYRTILGMTLQAGQQLTGANYFFYYGASVFRSVGISDSYITQLILGGVNFGCTFLGLYLMERFGRRWPLILGGLWQSVWLFIFASVGVSQDTSSKTTGNVLIVSACLFILGYASTWAPGIWILIGETFPTKTRAKQGALATMSNWIWNFLIAFFTPFISGAINFGYGYVFAGCNLAGAIIVYFFLYESSGLSLEAVDVMYNDPDCKPWTSGKWSPPAHTGSAGPFNEDKRRGGEKAHGAGTEAGEFVDDVADEANAGARGRRDRTS